MSDHMDVQVTLVDDQVRLTGQTRDNPPITCDYFAPLGTGQGYTGLELLLVSLAACSATSILAVLRKKRKSIVAFQAHATGERRDTHPTCFHTIRLHFVLTSPDVDQTEFERALRISEESLCPVWAMLKGAVTIEAEWQVNKPSA